MEAMSTSALRRSFTAAATSTTASGNKKDKPAVVLRRLYRNLVRQCQRIDEHHAKQNGVKSLLARHPRLADLLGTSESSTTAPLGDFKQKKDDLSSVDCAISSTPVSLQEQIRIAFRRQHRRHSVSSIMTTKVASEGGNDGNNGANAEIEQQETIQDAMEGLRILYSINIDIDTAATAESDDMRRIENGISTTSTLATTMDQKLQQQQHEREENQAENSYFSRIDINNRDWWLQQVEWLPNLLEKGDNSSDPQQQHTDETTTTTTVPVFPLSGPVLPSHKYNKNNNSDNIAENDDDDHDDVDNVDGADTVLPLMSNFASVVVEGQDNIPLKIFEPRYRQMYQDLISSSSSCYYRRSFVVPFAHPYERGTFAKFGWLYEINYVEDVADQTSGQIALVCLHTVTRPVQIYSIVNPSVWESQESYLRAVVHVVDDDNNNNSADYNGISDTDTTTKQHHDRNFRDLRPLEELLHRAS
jgi:hypothetical protein